MYPTLSPGRTNRVPLSGCTSPAISRISVDFPDPFRPTSAIRSPSCTDSDAPTKSGSPPKVRLRSASVRIGGSAMATSR